MKASAATRAPIAVVGLGCRHPGGVTGPEDFWRLVRDGGETACEISADRWSASPEKAPVGGRFAALVNDLTCFDADYFGLSAREAASLDPQQRMMLEVACEALDRAGIPREGIARSKAGVFVGAMHSDQRDRLLNSSRSQEPYFLTGSILGFIAGRLSYWLGATGPSITVDTACSSSLAAVHLACQSLSRGEVDLALAGGVNAILSRRAMELTEDLGVLSPDGRGRPFDAEASGFVRGEGCGVVVLKRLPDAHCDGDSIWGLIRGSAINHTGNVSHFTVPNVESQKSLLQQALADAEVSPAQVGYVECHGAGTRRGDPTELEALRQVLGAPRADGSRCALGSVKPTFGHLEAGAGITGFLKALLVLRHGEIPALVSFRSPNPGVELTDSALTIPGERTPWPAGERPRFAGVSSFGLNGSSAHIVLEDAPAPERHHPVATDRVEILPLATRTPTALREQAARFARHLESRHDQRLADLCFTAATRRSHPAHRLAVCGSSHQALASRLRELADGVPSRVAGQPPRVVFVFPGQGSQSARMCRQLLAQEPAFRKALDACNDVIRRETGWSVREVLDDDDETFEAIDVVQPTLFAVEVALAALWRSWGIEPDALIGHSMGEVAAACVSGALALEDAVAVICRRSRLAQRLSGLGAMALTELAMTDAEAAIRPWADRISVAVNNSHRSTVLSGEPKALGELLETLEERGVFCRLVKVAFASHSPQVEPLRGDLLAALEALSPRAGELPIVSTVTGETVDGSGFDARYWVRNLRRPVRFAEAVEKILAADRPTVFVEISPHPILLPALADSLGTATSGSLALASLRRGAERESMLESLAALYEAGSEVAWDRLYPTGRVEELPTHPWSRDRHWVDPPRARESSDDGGSLLGTPRTLATHPGTRIWQTSIGPLGRPWLNDHRVQSIPVFPAAAFVDLAAIAASTILGSAAHCIESLALVAPLTFSDDSERIVQLVATGAAGGAEVVVASRAKSDEAWLHHATAQLRPASEEPPDPPGELRQIRARLSGPVSGQELYRAAAGKGLDYGPKFRAVAEMWIGDNEALARIVLPPDAGVGEPEMQTVLLDACLQVLIGLLPDDETGAVWLPARVGSLVLHDRLPAELWCHARADSGAPGTVVADLDLVTAQSRPLGTLRRVSLQPVPAAADEPPWLNVRWQPLPELAAPTRDFEAGRWLVVGPADRLIERCRVALEGLGGQVIRREIPERGAPPTAEELAELLARPSGEGGCRDAVLVCGEGASALPAAVESCLGAALHLFQAAARRPETRAPRLWLVTRGAQALAADDPVAPGQSTLWGLARVLRSESPRLRCTCIDLEADADDEIDGFLRELLERQAKEEEIALRSGRRFGARLDLRPPEPERVPEDRGVAAGETPYRFEIPAPGRLGSLRARAVTRRRPAAGEVEIEVKATGLNFVDVLEGLGTYPGQEPGTVYPGAECAGRIVAVGPGVENRHPGQRVVALAVGSLASHVTVDARSTAPWPDGLTAAQAAALPAASVTARLALEDCGRLRADEVVLIHSAAGGTGLAALDLARRLGARVFATAGTEKKRRLLRQLGAEQVFDSRSLSFAAGVLSATGGRGVDVLLNSLSGAAVDAGLSILAPGGRFVDLTKTESARRVDLATLGRGRSYSTVDLEWLARNKPDRLQPFLRRVTEAVATGDRPALGVESFPASRGTEALLALASGDTIGKLAIDHGDEELRLAVDDTDSPLTHPDATYLITGGLGGLGLATARWWVEQGARHLALVGRRGCHDRAQEQAIAELEGAGCSVLVVAADVADREALRSALDTVRRELPPLRGVFHAAGVLDDGLLPDQDLQRFRTVLRPKVSGAWNLHELCAAESLDHFVLYSSAAALLGTPGQGSYAAANAFLDGLACHRRHLGLPALSVDWGVFSQVGLATTQANRGERLLDRGLGSQTPAQGLRVLERLLRRGATVAGVVPLDVWRWLEFYPHQASSPRWQRLLRAERTPRAARTSAVRQDLEASTPELRRESLDRLVRTEVVRVLRLDPAKFEPGTSFARLGLDSLTGLELRNRLEASLGLSLPATLLWTYSNADALAEHLARELAPPEEAAQPEPQSPDQARSAAASLSDDEVISRLMSKLTAGVEAGE
ncbi:MAG: type I polyketide synthase [Acidobacteriota bacterium]